MGGPIQHQNTGTRSTYAILHSPGSLAMNKRKHAIKAAKAAKRKPYRKFDQAIDQSIAKALAARKKRR